MRDTLATNAAHCSGAKPSSLRKDCHPVGASASSCACSRKTRAGAIATGHHFVRRAEASAPRLCPPRPGTNEGGGEAPPALPQTSIPLRRPVANVTEWASRAGCSRASSRAAYGENGRRTQTGRRSPPRGISRGAANGLEGETVASHTRPPRGAPKRTRRALPAEIGRKVEELAQEESRALSATRKRTPIEEEPRARARGGREAKRTNRARTRERGDRAGQGLAPTPTNNRAAALAMVEVTAPAAQAARGKAARPRSHSRRICAGRSKSSARSLPPRREALEEDSGVRPREGRSRTREGLKYEEPSRRRPGTLVTHLKGKPECRRAP